MFKFSQCESALALLSLCPVNYIVAYVKYDHSWDATLSFDNAWQSVTVLA